MKKEFGYDEEKAEQIYFELQAFTDEREANNWIAPWPGYISNGGCTTVSNTTMKCQLNINNQPLDTTFNFKTMEVVFENTKDKAGPQTIAWTDDEGFHQKYFNGTTLPYGLNFIRSGSGMQVWLTSPQLTGSMFTRLYLYNGAGLRHFELFDRQSSITNTQVIVWKVNWEGKEVPVVEEATSEPSSDVEEATEEEAVDEEAEDTSELSSEVEESEVTSEDESAEEEPADSETGEI